MLVPCVVCGDVQGKELEGTFLGINTDFSTHCQGGAVMGTDLLCVTTVNPFLTRSESRSGMPGKQG